MRLAVIGASQSWYLSDLVRAARLAGDEIVPLPFTEISAAIVGQDSSVSSAGNQLRDFDAVLVRSMPPGSLEQVVFRMDALAQLESHGTPVFNSPRSLEICIDKYAATCRLVASGLNVPDTVVCQTVEQALAAFEDLDSDVVLKPIFGSEGRGIVRIHDKAIATRIVKSLVQTGCVFYLQRFIEHGGADTRIMVLGDQMFGVTRRNLHDFRTNISCGGIAEPITITDELREQAKTASASMGTEMAGVDFLDGIDGKRYAIEVNAVPGWRALSATLDMDLSAHVLRFIRSHLS